MSSQKNRIVIIGCSCSGKTTFARELAEKLNIPHIELDAIHWLPGWVERPSEELRVLVDEATRQDSWVVDGNYSKLRDIIWARANTLIWLNYYE